MRSIAYAICFAASMIGSAICSDRNAAFAMFVFSIIVWLTLLWRGEE